MKATAYVRVSTREQSENGVSLDAQAEAVRAYATMKGFELGGVVREEGVSGSKPLADREGGAKIMAAVRKGEAQAVIVTKLDRAFRDAADCLGTVREWDKRGVSLHIVDLGGNSIDTASAAGRFMLTVLAGAAEMERNLIAERTSAALQHKRRRGEKTGGDVPFGYDVSVADRLGDEEGTKTLVPNLREQKVIRLAEELRAQEWSFSAIARELNERGYTTKRGTAWTHKQVSRVLRKAA